MTTTERKEETRMKRKNEQEVKDEHDVEKKIRGGSITRGLSFSSPEHLFSFYSLLLFLLLVMRKKMRASCVILIFGCTLLVCSSFSDKRIPLQQV